MIPAATPRPEDCRTCEFIAFDIRVPDAAKRLVELLDPHHAVLVVRAGGAREAEGRAA